MERAPSGVREVGKCYERAAIVVTDVAQELTLTSGRKTIEIIPGPTEANEIYYGGITVTSARGATISSGKVWSNCKTGFSIYLVCAALETADVRIIEYD